MSLELLRIERVGAKFRLAGGVDTGLSEIPPCATSIEVLSRFGDVFKRAQAGEGPEWLRGNSVLVADPAGGAHVFEPAGLDEVA